MVTLGIKSIVTKRFPKKKNSLPIDDKLPIINLIKDLEVTHLDQVWTTDITYIQTRHEGTFYLITYIDYYSKKVIAWGLFDNQKTEAILKVLSKAIKIRKPLPGLISHSDKGSFTSMNHSCDENAAQESFHSLLKRERLYQTKLYTFEDAYRKIYDYIEGFYNPRRVHSSLGYVSPDNFEKSLKN